MNKSEYVPKIHEQGHELLLVEVLFEGKRCPICGKAMVRKYNEFSFPYGIDSNQDAQMKRAGIVYVSNTKHHGEYICVECEEEGMARFTCALCGKEKKTSKIQEAFGDPTEYLCTDCYETVPAKEWDAKVKKLEDAHQWDWG